MFLRKLRFLQQLERSQWLSLEALRALQLHHLKVMMRHAFETVPYYRALLKTTRVSPENIRSLSDLQRIPLTRKGDLQALSFADKGSSQYSEDKVLVFRSGGTEGQPSDVHCDVAFGDLRSAGTIRTLRANGCRMGDRIAVLGYRGVKNKFYHSLGLYRRFAVPIELGLCEQIDRLLKIRPKVLDGYPSRIQQIARAIKKRGAGPIRPRLIVTNSETLTDSARCYIRDVFGVDPTDVYESWEFGQIAWQCPKRNGLHVNADQLIVELIKDGRLAGPGELGELVVTGLRGRAAPLIRYATGDLAIAAERRCSCGRELPLLERIIGRINERLILSDNTEVMATTGLDVLLNETPGVKQFRAVQHVPGELEVWLIPDQGFGSAEERQLQERVCHHFRLDRVIIKRATYFEPTPAGKARLFVSTIPKE